MCDLRVPVEPSLAYAKFDVLCTYPDEEVAEESTAKEEQLIATDG